MICLSTVVPWGLAVKVALGKSLAKQKGNYGMGPLP